MYGVNFRETWEEMSLRLSQRQQGRCHFEQAPALEGSGKTLAYLLPALQRAREADEDCFRCRAQSNLIDFVLFCQDGDGTSTGLDSPDSDVMAFVLQPFALCLIWTGPSSVMILTPTRFQIQG